MRRSSLAGILVGTIALALLGVGCKKDAPTAYTPSTPRVQKYRPAIYGFTATPASVRAGGDSVVFEWYTLYATSVSISPNVGSVTPLEYGHKKAFVSATTAFVLTATNSIGSADDTAWVSAANRVALTIHGLTGGDSSIVVTARDGIWDTLSSGVTYTVAADGSINPPTVNHSTKVVASMLWLIRGEVGANVQVSFVLPRYFTSPTGPNALYTVNARSAGWAGNPFTADSLCNLIEPRVENTVTLVNGQAAVQIGGTVSLPSQANGNYSGAIMLIVAYTGADSKREESSQETHKIPRSERVVH